VLQRCDCVLVCGCDVACWDSGKIWCCGDVCWCVGVTWRVGTMDDNGQRVLVGCLVVKGVNYQTMSYTSLFFLQLLEAFF
jgi:hypothetical protein